MPAVIFVFPECEGVCHGLESAVASHAVRLTVCPIPRPYLVTSVTQRFMCAWVKISRDPSQHASLKAEIEAQSSSLYATARLWDDGIIKPTETRDVVGLGLALAARQRGSSSASRKSFSSDLSGLSWDGERKGFGVYRM